MLPARTTPLIVTFALLAGGGAPAMGQIATDPGFLAGSVADRLAAETRGTDQITNPEYIRRSAPHVVDYVADGDPDVLVDPFRLNWNRGTQLRTSLTSRYGAKLNVQMWGPASSVPGPHPAVLMNPGAGNDAAGYRGIAQGLAEAGYVVVQIEPQGQGFTTQPLRRSTAATAAPGASPKSSAFANAARARGSTPTSRCRGRGSAPS